MAMSTYCNCWQFINFSKNEMFMVFIDFVINLSTLFTHLWPYVILVCWAATEECHSSLSMVKFLVDRHFSGMEFNSASTVQ